MTDEQGKVRTLLEASKEGPKLGLYDEDGLRAGLSVVNDRAGLMLKDTNGNQRLRLGGGYKEQLNGTITTYPESAIYLFDADERYIWQAP